jgi:sugar phosphate isomerase/epimerase
VRLACASAAFDRALSSGELTQLELIDACARELAADGVVLDVRHFPRLDNDYLAQVKKMTTDLGLTVAAYTDDRFFHGDDDAVARGLDRTWRLGAPLLTARLSRETERSWSDEIEAIGRASALAKGANVTIAVRNAPETHAATGHDCKRLTKEADSAWLRLGLQPAALDAATDPATLAAYVVLLFADVTTPPNGDRVDAFTAFRGFLAIDCHDGAATLETMRTAIERRRR